MVAGEGPTGGFCGESSLFRYSIRNVTRIGAMIVANVPPTTLANMCLDFSEVTTLASGARGFEAPVLLSFFLSSAEGIQAVALNQEDNTQVKPNVNKTE